MTQAAPLAAPRQVIKPIAPWCMPRAAGLIFTSDDTFLEAAHNPDKPLEGLTVGLREPRSLREHLRQAQQHGATVVRIAYDYFFGGHARRLFPDMEEYQQALRKVSDVAGEFGMDLEPSILSPLELGMGYRTRTGESGRWMHYREGLRNPRTGQYSVSMWQHLQWCNNKGPTPVELIGARAFAFRERHFRNSGFYTIADTNPIGAGQFYAVHPGEIVELDPLTVCEAPGSLVDDPEHFRARRITLSGAGNADVGELDRVLVVLMYRTVEMDYFSPSAGAFLAELVRSYHDRGIRLAGLYSDEIHIQQDWCYHRHLEHGAFNLRYVSEGFQRAFAQRYGSQYADFAKWLVYFAVNQHEFMLTHHAALPASHVMGPSDADAWATFLLRRNYYRFLHDDVVDLMVDAKRQLQQLYGRRMMANYHSTWAESPTCDYWAQDANARRYEYTPDFVWSNTVHQASAACDDYFAWNDFLTGGNNDIPEQGFADRNYFGRAMGCSLAALNDQPLGHVGMWGVPREVWQRMQTINEVFGVAGPAPSQAVAEYQPRTTEVLCVYPLDLVAVDENFGSWVIQYGYANYISADQLIRHGRVLPDGRLKVKDSLYSTLVLLYEPMPAPQLVALVRRLVGRGGRVVWMGPPPRITRDGRELGRRELGALLGVRLEPTWEPTGEPMACHEVVFQGPLKHLPPMPIFTDMVVDRVHFLTPLRGAMPLASVDGRCVGALRRHASGGQMVTLGFRPRDDQSASTGQEARWLLEILRALGAYGPARRRAASENPAILSRASGYLVTRFPNGAIGLCRHYRRHRENWPSPFFRNAEQDRKLLEANPPGDDLIDVRGLRINGHSVSYRGRGALLFRADRAGRLIAFSGNDCTGIRIGRHGYRFSDTPASFTFHPLDRRLSSGGRAVYRAHVRTAGMLGLPLLLDGPVSVWAEGPRPGTIQQPLTATQHEGGLRMTLDQRQLGRWLYVLRQAGSSRTRCVLRA